LDEFGNPYGAYNDIAGNFRFKVSPSGLPVGTRNLFASPVHPGWNTQPLLLWNTFKTMDLAGDVWVRLEWGIQDTQSELSGDFVGALYRNHVDAANINLGFKTIELAVSPLTLKSAYIHIPYKNGIDVGLASSTLPINNTHGVPIHRYATFENGELDWNNANTQNLSVFPSATNSFSDFTSNPISSSTDGILLLSPVMAGGTNSSYRIKTNEDKTEFGNFCHQFNNAGPTVNKFPPVDLNVPQPEVNSRLYLRELDGALSTNALFSFPSYVRNVFGGKLTYVIVGELQGVGAYYPTQNKNVLFDGFTFDGENPGVYYQLSTNDTGNGIEGKRIFERTQHFTNNIFVQMVTVLNESPTVITQNMYVGKSRYNLVNSINSVSGVIRSEMWDDNLGTLVPKRASLGLTTPTSTNTYTANTYRRKILHFLIFDGQFPFYSGMSLLNNGILYDEYNSNLSSYAFSALTPRTWIEFTEASGVDDGNGNIIFSCKRGSSIEAVLENHSGTYVPLFQ
jgi:hypothetical protein